MKPTTPRPRPDLTNPPQSRRADVRFEPPPQLACTIAGYGTHVTIRNISLGGLGLFSDRPVPKGVRLELLLTLDRATVLARGHAVHCRPEDDGRWAVGIAFTKDLSTSQSVERLIDALSNSAIRFS